MENKLCPFCGAEPQIFKQKKTVKCSQAGCPLNEYMSSIPIEEWNHRFKPPDNIEDETKYGFSERIRTFSEFKNDIFEMKERFLVVYIVKIKTPDGLIYGDRLAVSKIEIEQSKIDRVEDAKTTMYYKYLKEVAWK